MGKLCWPNTGRGEAHIPGALHCRSSTCLFTRHTTASEAEKKYEDLLLVRHTTVSEAKYYIQ